MNTGTRWEVLLREPRHAGADYLAAEALLLMNLPNSGHELPLRSVAYFSRPLSLLR